MVEIRVDAKRGALKVNGALFAGSKIELGITGSTSTTSRVGLYVFDKRLFEEPAEPRTRVFPPPGFKCVALSERIGTKHVLDLNTQEILDQFSSGREKPGASLVGTAYLWDGATPEVVATGAFTVLWSPVYFTPTKTPVTMKGEKGDKGDAGKDAILTPMTPGTIPKVDATGKGLESSGIDLPWLGQRVTAYRNASGCLCFTTGSNPTL